MFAVANWSHSNCGIVCLLSFRQNTELVFVVGLLEHSATLVPPSPL